MKVQVLLSTYNGEKYLKEQLDSILGQKEVEVSILIRDDGSTDLTTHIIQEYAKKNQNINYRLEKNCGACQSFMKLLEISDSKAEYFAFSDQDDIWKKDKLIRAVNKLKKKKNKLALYCADVSLVDQDLKIIPIKKDQKRVKSFGNALIENICTGCTIVINQNLRKNILNHFPNPKNIFMHDWWMYMVASCFGTICYENKPCLFYRQHHNNTIGGQQSFFKQIKRRIKNNKYMSRYVPMQIREFRRLYEKELDDANLQQIDLLLMKERNPFKRLSIFRCREICRSKTWDNFLYKISFLFWR